MNFKDFNELASYLDSVPNINCGGCGVSAYFIYKFFKEQGKNPQIVFLHSSYDPVYQKNLEAANGKKRKFYAPGHAVVKIDGMYYDSTGIKKSYWSYDKEVPVTEKQLLNSLKADNWNDDFDRDQEVPEMEEKIGVHLPKL